MQTIAGNKKTFDVIVLGVGSMGSAASYYLAMKGCSVLGLEQFSIPNELSSHTGQSRLTRKAYYEHEDYVPLLERAFENWKHLEEISGEKLYYETGLLYGGMPGHPVMQGIRKSASNYNISLIQLEEAQMLSRYPQFHLPAGFDKVLEPGAGFLSPAKAIRLYAQKAGENGAIILENTKVAAWQRNQEGIQVSTAGETFYAKKLVITSGAWAPGIIPGMKDLLQVTRQVLAWVEVKNMDLFSLGRMPCWIIAPENVPGIWYGFPILPPGSFDGPEGFKLAHHFPGHPTTPETVDRTPGKEDESLLVEVMNTYFPGEYTRTIDMKICMYTNSPDEHFIIDFLPGYDKDVIIATGFSGHGFKFASVVGEILSDLCTNGATGLPVDFLRVNRF